MTYNVFSGTLNPTQSINLVLYYSSLLLPTYVLLTGQYSLLPSMEWAMNIGQWALPVLFAWEGNRKSAVALVVCQRVCAMSTCGLSGK